MATNPRFDSDDSERGAARSRESFPAEVLSEDLAELKAKFNTFGGLVTPDISANLALEILLNEVAEQACLATRATGAAIALERGGEWICRASAGSSAPRLGAKLDAASGLSGACVRTRETQRCDEAQSDARVDIEACRNLGVRSLIVFPLLLKGELAGVFELFSISSSAFGERDERTLEAISQRVLRIVEHFSEPVTPTEQVEIPPPIFDALIPARESTDLAPDPSLPDTLLPENRSDEVIEGRGIQLLTWILSAAVLTVAVVLTLILAQRLQGRKAAIHTPAAPSSPARLEHDLIAASSKVRETTPTSTTSNRIPGATVAVSESARSTRPAAAPSESPRPASSLRVYERGKEIFRIPAAAEQSDPSKTASSGATDATNPAAHEIAPAVERAGIYELSPEAVDANLLRRVEPEYPDEARLQQIQGEVVLEVRAGGNGSVQEVKLLSGQPMLANAAIAAVKQWRFRPHILHGQPVAMQVKVTLNFRLPR